MDAGKVYYLKCFSGLMKPTTGKITVGSVIVGKMVLCHLDVGVTY